VAYVAVARLGLALASLLAVGSHLWPGVLLGAVAANLLVGAPVPAALAIGLGNTLEALAAATALRRLGFHNQLDRVRDVGLLTAAALLAPLLSAGLGVLSLHLAGVIDAAHALPAFRAWWIGDTLGALVVAPLMLTFWTRAAPTSPREKLELGALALFTALSTWFVFSSRPGAAASLQQPFLVFPALIWAALRHGQRAAVRATFLVSLAAILATTLRVGPFARPQLHEGLLALQVFMGAISLGVLLLGAMEAERRRVQEDLREAVAVRDEFLSIAGHELRTPLSALTLDLSSLERRLAAGAAASTLAGFDSFRQRTHRAVRQVERLTQLVNRLLEVTRLRDGHLLLEREPLDLRDPVREVVDRLGEQAEQAGCAIALKADQAVEGNWDALAIEQVTINLLTNAIKYGAGKPIEVTVVGDAEGAQLTVRDQGIGVPPDDVAHIFDRFRRAVPARHFGGLGLGLYVARQIVDAHGGRIAVSSQPGVGSSFVVHLPRTGEQSPAEHHEPHPAS
jgi:signal transduction histidine kinase